MGVGSRFIIDSWISKSSPSFPLGTLAINILGCLIAGFVAHFGAQKELALDPVRLGVIVGFCGGFTTFSGFGLQFLQLLSSGRQMAALAYGIGSPFLCIIATSSGYFLSKAIS